MVLERALALMPACRGSLICAGHALHGCLVLESAFALMPVCLGFFFLCGPCTGWFCLVLERALALMPACLSVPATDSGTLKV